MHALGRSDSREKKNLAMLLLLLLLHILNVVCQPAAAAAAGGSVARASDPPESYLALFRRWKFCLTGRRREQTRVVALLEFFWCEDFFHVFFPAGARIFSRPA